jgi:hypothetical protein
MPGEELSTTFGIATVASNVSKRCITDVHNIEVHGEHVYQVGQSGVLVHNSVDDCLAALRNGLTYQLVRGKSEAALSLKDDILEVIAPYVDDGFLALVDDIRTIAGKTDASQIVLRDVGFGFGTIEGKATALKELFGRIGTMTKTGDEILGEVYTITINL